ncbi:MAG TPA: DUF262 domain-containing protein [Candidatus Acidoferrum sp.]|nr:DUF262 domain-containing protein [Candidatus Acidoferrum sp.]
MPDKTLVDLGQEPKDERAVPLEEKYREQMRQIISQKIELPVSTLVEMISGQINLNPDFQRRDRWDRLQQSRFIESIIMNVPIPPVFLGEDEYGKYVVLDGRQRLTAVFDFLTNIYPLKGLTVWAELNKLKYADLQKKGLDRTIIRRFIPAVVILKESSPSVKYDVFDRLNTGGVIANAMEIRNAVYPGGFNELMHELSQEPTFLRLWDIPLDRSEREKNTLFRKMTDLELILRFFALREYERMDMRFQDYLGDYMQRRNKEYQDKRDLKELDQVAFRRAIQNSWRIFGENAFKKPGAPKRKSAPLADAVMIALSTVETNRINDHVSEAIRIGIERLCENANDFQNSIGKGTNGKGAITTRIVTATGLVGMALQNA